LKKDPAQEPGAESLRLDDPLTVLKGIGPKTSLAMAAEGIHCIRDLLLHLPRRYEDRSALTRLDGTAGVGERILIRAKVRNVRVRRIPRRRLSIVDAVLSDGIGEIAGVWFNQPWIARRLESRTDFYFYGQVREKKGGALQLSNPEIEEVVEEAADKIDKEIETLMLKMVIQEEGKAIVDWKKPLKWPKGLKLPE